MKPEPPAIWIFSSITDSPGKFNLLDLVGIKLLLERELGLTMDVTTRSSLHPMLKTDIEKTAIRVF